MPMIAECMTNMVSFGKKNIMERVLRVVSVPVTDIRYTYRSSRLLEDRHMAHHTQSSLIYSLPPNVNRNKTGLAKFTPKV